MSGSKRELLLLLAPILQLQARLSFSFLLLPLLLLLPIVIEFCVCRQSGKQAKSSRAEAAAKRKQFQAKFSLNASATRWPGDGDSCRVRAWQTVARLHVRLVIWPKPVESRVEQRVDCLLLPTARLAVGSNYAYFGIQLTWICCTGATWFHSFSRSRIP